MKYLLILASEPATEPEFDESTYDAFMAPWIAYTQELIASGAYVGGEALHGPETATTVRISPSGTSVVDGPFAELKEHLGGYYLIDVDTLDEAIEWARKIPLGEGAVEVRPIMPTD